MHILLFFFLLTLFTLISDYLGNHNASHISLCILFTLLIISFHYSLHLIKYSLNIKSQFSSQLILLTPIYHILYIITLLLKSYHSTHHIPLHVLSQYWLYWLITSHLITIHFISQCSSYHNTIYLPHYSSRLITILFTLSQYSSMLYSILSFCSSHHIPS